jgi:hypothetical protein
MKMGTEIYVYLSNLQLLLKYAHSFISCLRVIYLWKGVE